MKYYNTETNKEAIEGYHDIFVPVVQVEGEEFIKGTELLPNIVAIADGHIFMQSMPRGKVFTYTDGVPSGYEDAPVRVVTAKEQAAIDKLAGVEFEGVMCSATKEDMWGLTSAAMYVSSGQSTMFQFDNGNELLLTPDNMAAFQGVWGEFRASFF